MTFNPQNGQFGIRTQPVKGTYSDPGAAAPAGVFFRTRGGALGGKRELLIPDPEIGGGRDIPDAVLGPIIWAGEIEFYVRMEAAATLLYGALGGKSSSVSGVGEALVGTHVLTPADILPWLSAEEAVADSYDVFNYTDLVVNTLHMECDASGYFMGTVGLLALKQTAGNTRTAAPHWDPTNLIVGTNVSVTYNSVVLPAKKFSIDINNNIEDNDFRLGSLFAADLAAKRREVSLGVTIRPNDSNLWRQAVLGAAAATSAQGGTAAKSAVEVSASTYENIGTSSTPYSLLVEAPSATIAPYDNKVSGDDIIENDLEIRLFRPDPAVDLLTATVDNGLADVA